MSYQLSIEPRENYLYVEVTGNNSRDAVREYLDDLHRECQERDTFRVLINEKLSGPRLEALDVFNIAAEGAMRVLGTYEAIAYVDEQMGEMGEFAETVAVNRGMPIAFFRTVEAAEEWISSRTEGPAEQSVFWPRDSDTPDPGK